MTFNTTSDEQSESSTDSDDQNSTADDGSEGSPRPAAPAIQLPVDSLVDVLAAEIRQSDPKTQTKQLAAIGSAALLLAVYMVLRAHPSTTLPPGMWGNIQPIVLALFGVGFGSEAFRGAKMANEKRKNRGE